MKQMKQETTLPRLPGLLQTTEDFTTSKGYQKNTNLKC